LSVSQIIRNHKIHKVLGHLDINLASGFIKHYVNTICDLDIDLLRVRIVKNPFFVLHIAHGVVMAVVSTNPSMHNETL
jgi:hypothetical protein